MGINKRRRHRAWPESVKREIVAATLLPGSSVSRVARRYDVNANQVFAWRRRYRDGSAEPAELRLLPVTVTPDRPEGTALARARGDRDRAGRRLSCSRQRGCPGR